MDRIGGFSGGEIKELINFIDEGKKAGRPLTSLFKEFGATHMRSAGSVRNFYYQLVAMANANEEIYKKYFDGLSISVGKILPFSEDETKYLMDKILEGKLKNRSVRKTLMEIGSGDEKLVLRYQNKFRNIIKQDPDALKNLARKKGEALSSYEENRLTFIKSDSEKISRLRQEINGLVERISAKVQSDNELLKKRVTLLEAENCLLMNKLKNYDNSEKVPLTVLASDSKEGNSQHTTAKC